MRGVDRGHPFPHGVVHRVLERTAPRGDRPDLGSQQLHTEDVELLTLRVHLAHEHRALQAEQRRCGGRGHTVLACAGLGDHA